MRHTIPLFAFLLLLCSTISSQHPESEEGLFAYGNDEKGQFATVLLAKKSYKYDVALKVLTDLITAKGDRSMPAPTLKMSNAARYVAYAKPDIAVIGLEEKAYDICTSFGKDSLNALASLLAHELTHYYEKHDWTNPITPHKDKAESNKIKSFNERMNMETQADYLGGFLAYTAGYPTFDIMPFFLEKIYEGYRFPPEMKGYPTLPQRQEIANKALEKLQRLVLIFETANWLVALQQYEMAKIYYDYILLTGGYQSREVHNNLGVMATLAAIDYTKEKEVRFAYPIELDPISRISKTTVRGNLTDREKIIKSLLNNAIANFKNSLLLDEEYPSALLNLGCAYALLGEYFDAEYYAKKAVQLATETKNEKTKSDAEILLGIISAQQMDTEIAIDYFDKAIASGNPLAAINKNLMNENPPKVSVGKPTSMPKEKIDSINLDLLVNTFHRGEQPLQEKIQINEEVIFGLQNQRFSKVLLHVIPSEQAYTFFHITNQDYPGKTTNSIGLGASVESITTAYGPPRRTMEISNGQYLIYDKQATKGLIFVLQEGRLQSWCNYRKTN